MFTEVQTFIANFVISGSAAVLSKTIIAPVERAKLILQSQTSVYQIIVGQREQYKGLIDIFRRVPKEQGLLSLWRGNAVNLMRYFPSQALNFSLYDAFKHGLYRHVRRDTYSKTVLCKLTAGGLAGGLSAAIVFPLHFCHSRLSVDIGSDVFHKKCKVPREFSGLQDCITRIIKKDGIRGLYRGLIISTVGITVYRACYFGLFDVTKQMYHQAPAEAENYMKPPFHVVFTLAQVITILSGFASYPLDTISRHMMLDSGRPEVLRKCETLHKTCRHIIKTQGFTGFYLGALTNVFRSAAGALVLVLYDEFLYYTDWKEIIRNSKYK